MLPLPPDSSEFDPKIYHPLYLIRSGLYRNIRELAPSLGGVILDFGCGLKPYKRFFHCDQYIGVDYKGEGQTYSHDHVDVFYDGKVIPFANSSIDGIFTSEVFEHIFNLNEIIPELHRVLKKGGRMLITCPFAFPEHETPQDFARYTSFALKNQLESAGFKVIEQRKIGTHQFAITQLRIIYLDTVLLAPLNNVPIVRTIIRRSVYTLLNVSAIIASKLLPNNENMYLSNVLLVEKI